MNTGKFRKKYQFEGAKNIVNTLVNSAMFKPNASSFNALYSFLSLYETQCDREQFLKLLALIPDCILGKIIRFAKEYARDEEFADILTHYRTALSHNIEMPELQ